MTTALKKPVKRRSEEWVRDRSKMRRLVVTIYPAGYIGLRLEGCRTEETITLTKAHRLAIEGRIDVHYPFIRISLVDDSLLREREEKRKAKGGKYLVKRGKL